MTKIICTADNHIGFRQYGLIEREKDIEDGFNQVVLTAVEHGADAITVSGDILHSTRPTSRTMAFMAYMHQTLRAQSIPCYVISGNHDKSEPHWISMLGNEDELGRQLDGGFCLIDNKRVLVGELSIYGQPFVSKSEWEEVKNNIPSTDILLMHQAFSEWTVAQQETGFGPADLVDLDVSVVVMGDTHVRESVEIMRSPGDTNRPHMRVASPGSTELISASEDPEKAVTILEYTPAREKWISVTSRYIKTRPVIKNIIENEDMYQELVDAIQNLDRQRAPLLFIDYGPEMTSVVSRLKIAYPDLIIRARPAPTASEEGAEKRHEASADIDVGDLLTDLLPKGGSTLNTLALRLANTECDVNVAIDQYVQTRLQEEAEEVVDRVLNKLDQ